METSQDPGPIADAPAQAPAQLVLTEVGKVIVGQDRLLERVLIALLANGHLLIEGVPGLAKTRTIRTFSEVLGGKWQRAQFTPDLVPADVLGTRVWRPDSGTFATELGPVNANFLLADEINRAPAKVQSALLEAMEERQVTIGRETFALPSPFLVLATQNPVESEGTYAMPEAQTDRFLMRVIVDYPTATDEMEIVRRSIFGSEAPRTLLSPDAVQRWQADRHGVHVPKDVGERIVALVRSTRDPGAVDPELDGAVELGAGVRGSLALVACAQARALVHERDEVTPGDVSDLAVDVLAHRLVLSYDAAMAGLTQVSVVERLVDRLDA